MKISFRTLVLICVMCLWGNPIDAAAQCDIGDITTRWADDTGVSIDIVPDNIYPPFGTFTATIAGIPGPGMYVNPPLEGWGSVFESNSAYFELYAVGMLFLPGAGDAEPLAIAYTGTMQGAQCIPDDVEMWIAPYYPQYQYIGEFVFDSYRQWSKRPTNPPTLSPSQISQNQCVTMLVENGPGMTVDAVFYGINQDLYFPMTLELDEYGEANVCPNGADLPDAYMLVAISNAANGVWDEVPYFEVGFELLPGAPTFISFTPSDVYRDQCYDVVVGNGNGMTIDLKYRLDYGTTQYSYSWLTLPGNTVNNNGYTTLCTSEGTWIGVTSYDEIRNSQNSGGAWTEVYFDVMVRPPQPTWVTMEPDVLTQGDCFWLTVGHGGSMTLDVAWQHNGGAYQYFGGWPTLSALPNGDGEAYICTTASTPVGEIRWTYVKNTLNVGGDHWVYVNEPSTVYQHAQTTITSITPQPGMPGNNVSVTITGTNLLGATLSTTYPGLTIQNVDSNISQTTITATFVISSSAARGAATVTATKWGAAQKEYAIGPVLSKEYIYLGGRVLAIDSQ